MHNVTGRTAASGEINPKLFSKNNRAAPGRCRVNPARLRRGRVTFPLQIPSRAVDVARNERAEMRGNEATGRRCPAPPPPSRFAWTSTSTRDGSESELPAWGLETSENGAYAPHMRWERSRTAPGLGGRKVMESRGLPPSRGRTRQRILAVADGVGSLGTVGNSARSERYSTESRHGETSSPLDSKRQRGKPCNCSLPSSAGGSPPEEAR
ncbi:unnamed protein product [Lampetra fluviatilis]